GSLRFVRGIADNRNSGHVWPSTAVRAPAHADDQLVILQTEFGQQGFDPCQKRGQGAFGFGQGQAASRQSGAGHRGEASPAERIVHGNAVLTQELFDLRAMLGAHIHEQNVLRSGETDFRLETLDNAAQAGFELVAIEVFDAAILNEETEKIIPRSLLMPAKEVALFGEFEGTSRLELDPSPLLDLDAEPVNAPVFQDVFEPGMFAVGAVAKIAMDGNHRFGECFEVFGSEE